MTFSARSPIDVVMTFLKAMEVKDYDAAMPLIAGDCEYANVPMSTVHGPAGVRAVAGPARRG